eukprot:Tamp_32102.p3 GENE.Tamp_32102~~Tamp_32102.p3  ORF type:complete len:106 (+),score=4.20 Tamp_32102:215-532(+)
MHRLLPLRYQRPNTTARARCTPPPQRSVLSGPPEHTPTAPVYMACTMAARRCNAHLTLGRADVCVCARGHDRGRTRAHTHMRTCKHACIHAFMHACLHSCMHTYV